MSKPKILYDNAFADGAVVASSTAAGKDARNLADGRPYTWWAPTALPATLTAYLDTAKSCNTACLVAHNLASMGCDVQIRGSTDQFAASDVLVASVTPGTDGPVWQAFTAVAYAAWRLVIDGPGAPSIDYDFAGLKALPAGVTFARADASPCATYWDADGVLRTAAANVARFDHHPVSGRSLGLLIEESRTNLLSYSDDLANAAWSKEQCSVSSNALLAPNGQVVADKIVENTAAGVQHAAIHAATVAANTTHAHSVFLHAGERPAARLSYLKSDFSTGVSGVINLTTGAISGVVNVGTGSGAAMKARPLRNGWWRVEISGVIDAASTAAVVAVYTHNGTTDVYTGDGVSGIYVWGADLEAGSFATSHKPTGATTVTRQRDAVSVTGGSFSAWFNALVGTFLVSARYSTALFTSPSAAQMLAQASDNTYNNRVALYGEADRTRGSAIVAGAATLSPSAPFVARVIDGDNRIAYAAAANDSQQAVNGTPSTADASGAMPAGLTRLDIGSDHAGFNVVNGHIARLSYWPRRLTNAQLQWLTAADRGTIGNPSIAIAMIGAAMTLPTYLEQGFDPRGRKVEGRALRNNLGQPLGRLVDFESWEQTLTQRHVPWSWIRSTWQPAWAAHLRSSPFAFCWEPDNYGSETVLAVTGGEYDAPHRAGSLCDLSVKLLGVAT